MSPDQCFEPFKSISRSNPLYGNGAIKNILVNWKETLEAHVYMVDVPGIKMEELEVKVVDGFLHISGKYGEDDDREGGVLRYSERFIGGFCRRFLLPKNAIVHEMTARLKDGVLTLTLPKHPKPKTVNIEISR